MKKFLSLALTGVLIFMFGFITAYAQNIAGDVDSDGFVRAADARIVLRAAVGLEALDKEKLKVADVDNSGIINSADARLILRAAVGLEVLHIHTYNTEIIIKEATCIENGQKQYVCACSAYKEEIIPATGHTFYELLVFPTCTKKGYTTKTCKDCSEKIITDYISAKGHTYESVVTAPTCTKKGYATKTCKDCSEKSITDYISAKGHTYESVVTAPTCTKKGYTAKNCKDCSEKIITDYTDAKGHTYESVVTAPTCTKKGYTTKTCKDCFEKIITDYTDAKGHSYESIVTPPTCTEKGYTTYTCSDCTAAYISDYVNKKGHLYESTEILPTCTQDGEITYSCLCGDSYSENIPADGHSFAGAACTVCSALNPDYVEPIKYSSLKGCITFNNKGVAVGDQDAKLLLIPMNNTVKNYDNTSAASFVPGNYESGIRVRVCDSSGSYNFSSEVPTGKYLLVVVSANSNSLYRYTDEYGWNCYINDLLDDYFSQTEISCFMTWCSFYRIEVQEIEVVADAENIINVSFEASDW